jgi:hypothetical protein
MRRFWKAAIAVLSVTAIIVVTALGMTSANAGVPDAQGTVHVCYRPSGPAQGQLVVIDSDVEECPAGYSELTWDGSVSAQTLGRETVTATNVGAAPYTLMCPTGKVALSGGIEWNGLGAGGTLTNSWVVASHPTDDGTGWSFVWRYPGYTANLSVICVDAS